MWSVCVYTKEIARGVIWLALCANFVKDILLDYSSKHSRAEYHVDTGNFEILSDRDGDIPWMSERRLIS
jgi:hypothetical protein